MNSEQGVYKLPICGTTKIIGVGIIGNINLLLFLYYHHPNLDNNIYRYVFKWKLYSI